MEAEDGGGVDGLCPGMFSGGGGAGGGVEEQVAAAAVEVAVRAEAAAVRAEAAAVRPAAAMAAAKMMVAVEMGMVVEEEVVKGAVEEATVRPCRSGGDGGGGRGGGGDGFGDTGSGGGRFGGGEGDGGGGGSSVQHQCSRIRPLRSSSMLQLSYGPYKYALIEQTTSRSGRPQNLRIRCARVGDVAGGAAWVW